jgi:hypothetical protein
MLLLKIDGLIPKSQRPHKLSPIQFKFVVVEKTSP